MSKLDERRKQYDIPPAPSLPQGKKIWVYRLPLQQKTAGGLFIPEEHANPEPMGVLVAAGLLARDRMKDALIEIGDIVQLPRFTTNSPEVERKAAERGKHMELLNIEDLAGSVDGAERLEKEYTIEYDEEIGEHYYARAVDPEPATIKKGANLGVFDMTPGKLMPMKPAKKGKAS